MFINNTLKLSTPTLPNKTQLVCPSTHVSIHQFGQSQQLQLSRFDTLTPRLRTPLSRFSSKHLLHILSFFSFPAPLFPACLIIQTTHMVKKDQDLQIQIMYSRQDGMEHIYTIERRKDSDQLTYSDVLHYRDLFMEHNRIYTDVVMSYLSDDDEMLPINEDFFLSYRDFETLHDGNFLILIKPEMDCLYGKIDEIEEKVMGLEKQIKELQTVRKGRMNDIEHTAVMRKHISAPEVIKKQYSEMPEAKCLDIGILFSEPLVQKKAETEAVRLLADPVKYCEEIARLKRSLERTKRYQIYIKCCIATSEYLDNLLRQKTKILHLICHGSIQVVKNKGEEEQLGVLQFQHLNSIGYMEKIYGSDIPGLLSSIPQESRPKLVFVNACHSELIGDAFLSSGVPFVVVIQSSEKIEDTAAQEFSVKFYNSLFNGVGVKDSFQQAKAHLNRQNRPVNSNICCCFHPNSHQPKCLFKQLCDESGPEIIHELYHVPSCKCFKRHLNLHSNTCDWAIETLFNINRSFRVESPAGDTKPTLDQLQKTPQLLICCCSTPSKPIPHDETQKFKFKYGRNVDPNEVLFEPNPTPELQADVIDETSKQLQGNFMQGQRLFGRNMNIFNLIYQLKQNVKVVIVYGSEGSGKTRVTTRAVSYMYERGYFKDYYFYIDMGDVTTAIDFNSKIIKKAKHLKLNNLFDIYATLAHKEMVFVLDNIDLFIRTSYHEFKKEISLMLDKLSNTKLVMVLNDKTVKSLDISIFNERRYFLEPLKKFAAADMFIMHAKEYLAEINMKDVWRLFEDESLRFPKTILDMVHLIKSRFSPQEKIKVSELCKFMDNIKSTEAENEKFLERNIEELSRNKGAFNLFLFLCEFRDGLTETDFEVMSRHSDEEIPMEAALLPSNWRQVLFELLHFNSPDEQREFKEGQYYYCEVETKADSKKFRVKRYIQQFMHQQHRFQNPEMKFNAIAYLSVFAMNLIKIMQEQFMYHEKVMEYSNNSKAGVFQFQAVFRFREYFDEGDYFPDNENENMSQSIRKNKRIDEGMRELFQHKNSLTLDPSLSINLHQGNIRELYRTDYSEYYQNMASEKRKLFKYYYLHLMLNIPTIIKMLNDPTDKDFLNSCIHNSMIRVRSLEGSKQSRTINLCLIKLFMIKIVVDLEKVSFPDQGTFRPYFESIKMAAKPWDENTELCRVIRLEECLLTIGILYRQLKESNKSQTYTLVLKFGSKFKSEYEGVRGDQTGNLILLSKYQLMMAQCFYVAMDKMKSYKGFEQFKNSYDLNKKEILLKEALQIFKDNNLKLLEVRTMVKIVRVKYEIAKRKGNNDDVNEYFHIKSEIIAKIRQLLANTTFKIILKQSEVELNETEEKVNKKIWAKTKNFLVFMKACPIVKSNRQESLIFNSVRRTHNFKTIVESTFQDSLLDEEEEKGQKEVSVRFEILTKHRGVNIINQGCSLLILTINAKEDKDKVYLQFEDEELPIENRVELGDFLKEVNFKSVSLLMICGQGAHIVGSRVRELPQETPMLITVDYKSEYYNTEMDNLYEMGYCMFSLKSLQRIAIYYFIKAFIEKLVFSPKKSNQEDIVLYAVSARENTLVYMMGFSVETSNKEKLGNVFTVQTHQSKGKTVELQFGRGSFHSVSTQRSSFHNLQKSDTTFIGREKLLIDVMEDLLLSRNQKKPYYLNIYGNRCSGKTSFLTQLSDMLIERGHFKKGLYILSGSQITNKFNGHINEYLQSHKSSIFEITYLNEKSLKDTSEMLIIIDDFHTLKDKTNYLDYFFNSIFNKNVNLIVSNNEKFSSKMLPDSLKNKSFQNAELKRMSEQESSFLSYTFIPLYNFEMYKNKFRSTFFPLKKEKSNFIPKMIITHFKEILVGANKNEEVANFPNYKSYVYHLQNSQEPFQEKQRSQHEYEQSLAEEDLQKRRKSKNHGSDSRKGLKFKSLF